MVTKDSEVTMVSAQFPVTLRDQLARTAEAQDRSISATLREAARVYLAQASPRGHTSALSLTGTGGVAGGAASPAATRRDA